MVSGVPAEASVELFNKLIHLPFSDKEEIGQIEFRLRSLHKKQPSDVRAKVALLQALMMAGKAEEAIETADSIWSLLNWLEADTKMTFVGQIAELGMFDRVQDLVTQLLGRLGDKPDPNLVALLIEVGIANGDIELLTSTLNFNISPDYEERIPRFIAELRRLGLEQHFKSHQAIVRDAVFGRQCAYLGAFNECEGHIELSVYIYVAEERAARRDLEKRIDAALQDYYAGTDVRPEDYVPLITTSVLPLTAHHAPAVM